MSAWPWFVASYLLGSLPTSWIVVKLVKGQDLRKLGSGNLGATNLYRQLGWRWAVPAAAHRHGQGRRSGSGVRAARRRRRNHGAPARHHRCPGPRLLALRELQGREGCRHRGRCPDRARALGRARGNRRLGCGREAHRICLAGQRPQCAGSGPRALVHLSGPARPGVAVRRARPDDRRTASRQHPAAAQREPSTASGGPRDARRRAGRRFLGDGPRRSSRAVRSATWRSGPAMARS